MWNVKSESLSVAWAFSITFSSWVLPICRQSTPGRPAKISFMRHTANTKWKFIKAVVSNRDEGASGICQNPLLASSLEKIFAPVIWAKVSSMVGSGWTSRLTDLLSGFFFGATTMPAHQLWYFWYPFPFPAWLLIVMVGARVLECRLRVVSHRVPSWFCNALWILWNQSFPGVSWTAAIIFSALIVVLRLRIVSVWLVWHQEWDHMWFGLSLRAWCFWSSGSLVLLNCNGSDGISLPLTMRLDVQLSFSRCETASRNALSERLSSSSSSCWTLETAL